MKKVVNVAVGVIKREGLFFMTKRAENVHQGGKWEFPGGKVEKGELPEQALCRELKEEVNIEVVTSSPLITINHDYGDKRVSLHVFVVEGFKNEPMALEGQLSAWSTFEELLMLDLPAANKQILDELQQQA